MISKAKIEVKRTKTHRWYTPPSIKALAWLLGYYDSDSNPKDGKYGRFHSNNEILLNLIVETFECIYIARSKGKPSGFSTSEYYYLVLGTEIFKAI